MNKNSKSEANRLIHESSPYLLQHAYNPVDWYPWGNEALEKASNEDKLLLISVGYAACHWCHVMEKESFMDNEVASIMNEHFVCIKVDREERPDIDHVYMMAVQLITRSGGWPLNCFALPDGKPVFGGTYFRKSDWVNLLSQLAGMYKNDKQKLIGYASNLHNGMIEVEKERFHITKKSFSNADWERIYQNWKNSFDFKYGGYNRSPKFPMPNNYLYLLRDSYYRKDKDLLNYVCLTLDKMSEGGLFDQIGGGFARYSVDSYWHVPHFEKMLYDNAQLINLYSEAFRYTKKENYRKVVEKTFDFLQNEFLSPKNGFYSSLDADSEGQEGVYYTWAYDEIKEIAGKHCDLICEYYGITLAGNWEHGQNILKISSTVNDLAKKYSIVPDSVEKIIYETGNKLLQKREKRIKPALDDKILSSWNGLTISGLINAYHAFGNHSYLDSAVKCGKFIEVHLIKENFRLHRVFKDEKSSINGFLDDYAFTISALIDLYQATFNEEWLILAHNMLEYVLANFKSKDDSLFYFKQDSDKKLVVSITEMEDNVIPASNSEIAHSLYRLGIMLGEPDYITRAEKMLLKVIPSLTNFGGYYSNWGLLFHKFVFTPNEIVFAGERSLSLKNEFMKNYHPNVLIAGSAAQSEIPILKNRVVNNKNLIYVCREGKCELPVETLEDALKKIKQLN